MMVVDCSAYGLGTGKRAKCEHPPEKLSDGPRVPLRWGSGPTQVCECGAYRTMHHKPGPWLPGPPHTEPDPEL